MKTKQGIVIILAKAPRKETWLIVYPESVILKLAKLRENKCRML